MTAEAIEALLEPRLAPAGLVAPAITA
jgi:hypothetical protein